MLFFWDINFGKGGSHFDPGVRMGLKCVHNGHEHACRSRGAML